MKSGQRLLRFNRLGKRLSHGLHRQFAGSLTDFRPLRVLLPQSLHMLYDGPCVRRHIRELHPKTVVFRFGDNGQLDIRIGQQLRDTSVQRRPADQHNLLRRNLRKSTRRKRVHRVCRRIRIRLSDGWQILQRRQVRGIRTRNHECAAADVNCGCASRVGRAGCGGRVGCDGGRGDVAAVGRRNRGPGAAVGAALGDVGDGVVVRHERFDKTDVKVAGAGSHGGDNAINAGADLRGGGLRDRGGAVQIELDDGGIGEQAVLDDGLVRAGAAIMRGAVGGQCQQRNARRGGFHHGGHEVRHCCAGRCNYRGHLAGARGQAEGEEGGGAFIDAHV